MPTFCIADVDQNNVFSRVLNPDYKHFVYTDIPMLCYIKKKGALLDVRSEVVFDSNS